MKPHLRLLLLLLVLAGAVQAQLPDGATAPNWTHTDIDGNTWNLYNLLDEGKMVVIEFSATWCGPCWNYMLTGALENFWEDHGPDGDNVAQVFYIEADQSTDMQDLLGLTPESQGNWVEAIPFPIIDLQTGEDTDSDYWIGYYPTLYAVCSDRKIYELGQVPASEWTEFLQSCALDIDLDVVVDAECFGEGEISLNVEGGVNPITYSWSNGANTPELQNIGAGEYSVTVTEGNGRNLTIQDIIVDGAEQPIELESSAIEDVDCYGANTGAVGIELENGQSPYSYEWSNGASTEDISGVPAGDYTVEATDANGCPFTQTFTVEEPEELVVEAAQTPDYCDSGNGTIELEIDGGTGDYDIESTQGNVFGHNIIDLEGGDVEVTVMDENGCIWEQEFDIDSEPAASVTFTPDPEVSCEEPVIYVTAYTSNGSGEYEYEWSTTNGNIIGSNTGESIQVDEDGDYFVQVYDLFTGCVTEEAVYVSSIIDLPVAEAGEDAPITCEIEQLILTGTGSTEYEVLWTTADGHIVSGANTYTPTVDAPGTYILTVLNLENSCQLVDSAIVINNQDPANANYTYQTTSLTFIGTDASSGSNVGNHMWDFGDGNTSTETSVLHTFATEGTYNVCLSVTNGCGTSQTCQSVQVTFTGSVLSVDAAIGNIGCNGDSTGTISLVVNGGSGNYTYLWTGPDGAMYSTPGLDNVPAGIYQVLITDDTGNVFAGAYEITEPLALVVATSEVTDANCFGESTGTCSISMEGGVGPYMFSLNGGPFQAGNSFSGLPAGPADVIVVDANGCMLIAGNFVISQPEAITSVTNISPVQCYGESNGAISVQIGGGVGPYQYLWDIGADTTQSVQNLPAGQYHLQVSDANGCIFVVTADVPQPAAIAVDTAVVLHADNQEHNNGSISLVIEGGVAPYIVQWNHGATGDTITGLIPGEYTYTIVDANGCLISSSAPIVVLGTTSTTSVDWNQYIQLAPNPSNGNTVVSWNELESARGVFTLTSIDGRVIAQREIDAVQGQWDLSGYGLQNGIFVVFARIDEHIVPFKLVVSK